MFFVRKSIRKKTVIFFELGTWNLGMESVVDGSAEVVNNDAELRREMLDSNKCFLIDTGHELFVWTGRNTSFEKRKAGVLAAEASI